MDLLALHGWDDRLVRPSVDPSPGASAPARISPLQAEEPGLEPPSAVPARVVAQERDRWRVVAAQGELLAEASGRLRRAARSALDLPLTGDWVLIEPPRQAGPCRVQAVLPRRTLLCRAAAGRATTAQGLAANVDLALVVTAPDRDLAPARLERYLTLLAGSGVRPVVLLNKTDLIDDAPILAEDLRAVLPGLPLLTVSALTGAGLEAVRALLVPGQTVVVLGSSGVGKSSLVNRLLGEARQETLPVRAQDDRGRHTTTRRELLPLPGGALLLDTPGLREVGPWSAAGLDEAFDELAEVARGCRFRDCTHEHEPGCAVLGAAEAGRLDPARLESFWKLRRELVRREELAGRRARYERRRVDRRERLEVRRRMAARDREWE